MRKSFKFGGFFLLILMPIIIGVHNVPKKITKEDKQYINLLLGEKIFDIKTANYLDEIKFITEIQANFNSQVKLAEGIPFSSPREPKNLYETKTGECYDRSRFLEKAFNLYGFKTRHLTAFTLRYGGKVIKSLLTKNHITHSTFEVKTKKGWLVVDTNFDWIALVEDGSPLKYGEISKTLRAKREINWAQDPPRELMHFYIQESFCVYGLYSRHGRFYPPYNPIPDYNLRELLYNF